MSRDFFLLLLLLIFVLILLLLLVLVILRLLVIILLLLLKKNQYAFKVKITVKGQCHEIFYLYFFHESNPPGPLIKRLKWFFFKICFCEDIQI